MDDKEAYFVDELVNASLRRYAAGEPRPGLEARVVAGVRARQQAARRRAAWTWAGVAAATVVAALLILHQPRRQTAPLPATESAQGIPASPVMAKPPGAAPLPSPPRHLPPARPRLVDWRPQQFPTPRPLSEQEKLLVAYAQALKNASPLPPLKPEEDAGPDLEIPPIRMAAIKIQPLPPLTGEEDK